ncbi:MAG TPA: DUF4105 domain-containing protein [Polyangiaceae bacterium]|nr:DUF4105 domain-containing protein [Polyangiaceae bacterium]
MSHFCSAFVWGGVLIGVALGGSQVAAQSVPIHGPVYLAYAGPYSSSPPSAFGHLFLIFGQDSTTAMPLWEVVSFAAETDSAGALRYMTVGIFGGFQGTYERLKFHEKSRDYELLEDRDLWLTELLLSDAQRSELAIHLDATNGQYFPYTFFERNCAYYLQLLLSKVLSDVPPPDGFTSPTGVMEVLSRSSVRGQSYFRPSASRRLEQPSDAIALSTRTRVRSSDWGDVAVDTSWLMELNASDRGFVQQYLNWKAMKRGTPLDRAEEAGFALLRYMNSSLTPSGLPKSTPGEAISRPEFHRYSRVSLGLVRQDGTYRTRVAFRPGVHDEYDSWVAHRPLNTMEILSFEASVSASENVEDPRIESIVLFSQRSLNPSSWLTQRESWLLEVVGERGGLFGHEEFHYVARSGGGRAIALGESAWTHLALTTAVVGASGDWAFAPGLDVGVLVLPSNSWRFGTRWTREHSLLDWSRKSETFEAWVRYDFANEAGVRVFLESREARPTIGLSLDWYP